MYLDISVPFKVAVSWLHLMVRNVSLSPESSTNPSLMCKLKNRYIN